MDAALRHLEATYGKNKNSMGQKEIHRSRPLGKKREIDPGEEVHAVKKTKVMESITLAAPKPISKAMMESAGLYQDLPSGIKEWMTKRRNWNT